MRAILHFIDQLSIGIKMSAAIFITVCLLLGSSFFLLIQRQKNLDLQVKIDDIKHTSNLIQQSIQYSMLQGEMDAVDEIIVNTSKSEKINVVSLLDSEFEVYTSSDPNLYSKRLDNKNLQDLKTTHVQNIDQSTYREGIITCYNPILLAEECLDCHDDYSAGDLYGVLSSSVSTTDIIERHSANTLILSSIAWVLVFLSSGLLYIITKKIVVNPIRVIAASADIIAGGDLEKEIKITTEDETGQLGQSLQVMVKNLKDKIAEVDAMMKETERMMKETDAMMQETDQVVDIVAGVMESASKKDLTKRIDTEFKGKFANLKVNVNGTIENLDDALNQVGVAVNQVSSASDQIASGSQALAQGSNEQASSLEEVSSSLEEMSSMTKQNSDNANQATKLSGEARSAADKGNQAMQEMIEAIEKIKTSSDETAKIVKTIDDIAFQTNLLALNAAVEAARAGDAGKGFAVVAEEVRNLAQKSAEAAKNTSDMINESVENAAGGVKITEDVAKLLTEIVAGSSKVNDLVSEIDAASKEQADGIEQVNTAVADMNKVTQQNAANSEESASASEEMNSQAAELSTLVGEFALTSNGSVGTQTTQPTAAAPVATRAVGGNGSNGSTKRKTAKKTKVKVKAEEAIPLDDADFGDF